MRHSGVLLNLLMVLAGTGLLMILPLIAGRPNVYPDTAAYYRLGEQAAGIIGLAPKEVKAPPPLAQPAPSSETPAAEPAAEAKTDAHADLLPYTTAGARSPYWSFFLYITQKIGTLWLTSVLHCLIAAWTLFAVFRAAQAERHYIPAMGVLALFTSLPLYANFVMPDIFTGLWVMSLIGIMVFWRELTTPERVGLWMVFTFAGMSHTTHWLVAAPAALIAAGILIFQKIPTLDVLKRTATIFAGVIVAVVSGIAFGATVKAMQGVSLYNPPFIAARVIADGPGREWLHEACADGKRPYVMCDYIGQPLVNPNDMLWARTGPDALYQLADYDRRVEIVEEQTRFLVDTVVHKPVGVFATAMANFGKLLVEVHINEVIGDATWSVRNPDLPVLAKITPRSDDCFTSKRCDNPLPRGLLNVFTYGSAILALAAFIILIPRLPREQRNMLLAATLIAIVAYLGNAAACGIFSGPYQRFQARIIWILPAMALIVGAVSLQNRQRAKETA